MPSFPAWEVGRESRDAADLVHNPEGVVHSAGVCGGEDLGVGASWVHGCVHRWVCNGGNLGGSWVRIQEPEMS